MPKNYQKAPRAIEKEMIKDLFTNALNAVGRTAVLQFSITGKQWRGGNSGHKKEDEQEQGTDLQSEGDTREIKDEAAIQLQ